MKLPMEIRDTSIRRVFFCIKIKKLQITIRILTFERFCVEKWYYLGKREEESR